MWSCISTTGIESFGLPEGAEHRHLRGQRRELCRTAAAYRVAHRLSCAASVEAVTLPLGIVDHLIRRNARRISIRLKLQQGRQHTDHDKATKSH